MPGNTKMRERDFPGGPAVKTPRFQRRGHGLDPWFLWVPDYQRKELRSRMLFGAAKKKKKGETVSALKEHIPQVRKAAPLLSVPLFKELNMTQDKALPDSRSAQGFYENYEPKEILGR